MSPFSIPMPGPTSRISDYASALLDMTGVTLQWLEIYLILPLTASAWHLCSPLMQFEADTSRLVQLCKRMHNCSGGLTKVNHLQPLVDMHRFRHSSWVSSGFVRIKFPWHSPWTQHCGAGGGQPAGPLRQLKQMLASRLVQLRSSWQASESGK